MLYLTAQTLHLLCACIVIGYLVYDVFVFSFFKKGRSEAEFTSLKRELLKPSVLLFAPAFLLLLASGAFLASFYMGGELGFWQNATQKMLWLKLAVIASLFVFTPISFWYLLVLKKPDPFRRYYHHLALVICLGALIIAKLLFIF